MLAVRLLPALSVAVQLTAVFPTANSEPEAGVQDGPEAIPLVASVAVAAA
jgi:hypothetical protein